MGLVKYFFKKLTSPAVEQAISVASEKVSSKIQKNINSTIDDFLSRNPNHSKYILNHYKNTWKDTYVFSNMQKKLYIVKGNWYSLKNCLTVYDYKTKKPIATIKEQLFSVKNPFAFYSSKKVFKVSTENTILGKAVVKIFPLKKSYSLPFKNWRIQQNTIGTHYTVFENDSIILETIEKVVKDRNIYYIDIENDHNTLYSLLTILIIEAAEISKRQRLKYFLRNKF